MDQTQAYSAAAIRRLLLDSFTAEELRCFCTDRPLSRSIVERFGPGYGLLGFGKPSGSWGLAARSKRTMTSPTPLEYGQYYHIYNRGNNRQNLFIEERNYYHFLKLYAKYILPIADTFAYCLLPNHFHLLVRILTPQEQTLRVSETLRVSKSPSQQFGNLFNAYAKAINKAYNRTGSLFENPFGRVPVTTEPYLVCLVAYIHQNPQKHGFVADFSEWPFSSYHAVLSQKPTRLERDEVLAWFQSPAAFQDAHRQPVSDAQMAPLVPDDFD